MLYTIKIQVGNVSSGGSHRTAGLFLKVAGELGESSEIILGSCSKGQLVTNQFEAENLGKLQKVMLRADGEGVSPGWYPRYVLIKNETLKESYIATVEKWLDDENSTPCRFTLYSLTEEEAERPVFTYRVKIHVGEGLSDGTDAKVYCTVKGEKGTIPPFLLDNGNYNEFERNIYDEYKISWPDLGEIVSAKIDIEELSKDDLKLESVSVKKERFFR